MNVLSVAELRERYEGGDEPRVGIARIVPIEVRPGTFYSGMTYSRAYGRYIDVPQPVVYPPVTPP